MNTVCHYDNYPLKVVCFSNIVTFCIYLAGIIILANVGISVALLYLLYILILEFRLIRFHCVNCYYWGKTCAFGKGRISALFFKKGNPEKFCMKSFGWKDMIPDLLVSLIPFFAGIYLLFIRFNLIVLLSLIVLVFLSTKGNAFIRQTYACKYCKQRELGCPAEKLFSKSS